ncbi:pyruvate ferredoxin oxidoreductase [miscellaneous Crenarchaeota group-15 archaeon DG-45]|uniref:Pyruvate ferredoxin oxidoreductase n=1 Tax=miscellaneous Crenarchaeota group-15 archaeon DG-45 TaxID=1685127 RepID=A0A0M0BMP5_9ARCH|nr:MAG: pyruvate ferredoxin oxidoreductase [miscellaneous Crenarchaeota group-15 archaeon DG-45]
MSEQKPGWRELSRGAIPYMSSEDYETGDWGVERPEIDRGRCTKCMLCHFYCPEGAIRVREDGYTEVDLRYCKGCGVCAAECPVKCIEMVRKT